ncbi:MAG: cytochrome c [Pirellulaceae bacterium]|nr:MAG: cytochrome c [Pirellulaceae bacterium]
MNLAGTSNLTWPSIPAADGHVAVPTGDPAAVQRHVVSTTQRGWPLAVWLVLTALVGCRPANTTPFDLSQATYVGSQVCADCHREEVEKYRGSHHDMAMQRATEQTVRADFDNVKMEHHGIVSTAYRDGERFMIRTEGPDGELHDYEIKYTFGWEPLQQYMVEFPAPGRKDDGTLPRLQVLRLSWDTERRQWFYLAPPDVSEKLAPDDDLHWTGIAQRWNTMCAECHSTNYQKNFLPSFELEEHASGEVQQPDSSIGWSPGEYHSTFSEINVACEACHGPGSVHVELAQQWFPGWSRERGYGLANLKRSPEDQIQSCAPCHSRRNVVHPGFQAGDNYYDYYSNELLLEPIYYPDGQILDEDYVHGSFIQSKMYHKSIRCTDCHDPHSARLKAVGNAVCTSCHQHPAAKYDSVGHHFHQPGSPGAQCVNCHMPATTYMQVDARRDHSIRIPRPDLSSPLETPNACTGCHVNPENVSQEKRDKLKLYQDWMAAARQGDEEVAAELHRANQWCDAACQQWYGEQRQQPVHFGVALDAGQEQDADAVPKLRQLLRTGGSEGPAIARATALELLARLDASAAWQEASRAAEDEHPLLRAAAARALAVGGNPTRSVHRLEQLLADPVRSVRVEAARSLLDMPRQLLSPSRAADFRKALEEMAAGLRYNNDRSGAHLALALIAESQGRLQQAIRHYENAIAVEPRVTGPRTNLAALLERTLQHPSAETETAAAIHQRVHQLRKEELALLQRDVELLPDAAAIRYRYGLALYLDGQAEAAAEHLVAAATLEPTAAAYAQAAALLFEHLQKWDDALYWAREAVKRNPEDPANTVLLQRIAQAAGQATNDSPASRAP